MKLNIYSIILFIAIIGSSTILKAQVVTEQRVSLTLYKAESQTAYCSGSKENIKIFLDSGIPKSLDITLKEDCSIESYTLGECGDITWEGQSIKNTVKETDPGTTSSDGKFPFCRTYIEVRPTAPGIYKYTLKFTSEIKRNATSCAPASIHRTIYEGETSIIILETPPTPKLVAKTIIDPIYPTEEIVVLSVPNIAGVDVEWHGSPWSFSGNELRIDNPYDCKEQKARYHKNGCFSEYSNAVAPAKAYKPTLNPGYGAAFSSFLAQNVNSSIGQPEHNYRKFYSCLQRESMIEYNKTGENGWAGGFVKELFNAMASKRPCMSTIERECNIDNEFLCKYWLGLDHFLYELTPNFFSYPINSNEDFDSWDRRHNSFLAHATLPCSIDAFPSPDCTIDSPLQCFQGAVDWALTTVFTIDGGFYLREYAQFSFSLSKVIAPGSGNLLNNSYLNTQSIEIPQPISKEVLFSTKLENISNLKIKSDTVFFILTNKTFQLSTTYINDSGILVDVTNTSSGTQYELSVDTTIATISQNGLLKVKSTLLPFVNGRMPLKIIAKNGNRVGISQFAIIDTDVDNDLIADSYERRIGLNPNVPNLGDSDGDFLLDFYEAMRGSNPLKRDTDDDNFSDFIELKKNTNLTNVDSYPLPIESISSGIWNNSNCWSCNCIPSQFDAVIINAGHNIAIPSTFSVDINTILINEGATFNAPLGGKFKGANN